MIKARKGNAIFLGLDRENINRLLNNEPILIEGKDLLLDGLKIIIVAGETLEEVREDLRTLGING